MSKIYKCKPSLFLLLLGLGVLYVSGVFFRVATYGEMGFFLLVGFFGLTCFAFGLALTLMFLSRFIYGDIILHDDFVEIPGRWRKRTTLYFNEINMIREIDSWEKAIEIRSTSGLHRVEGNWMKRGDFQELCQALKAAASHASTETNLMCIQDKNEPR